MREEYKSIGYTLVLSIVTYGLLSLAVDRGSPLVYILAFVTLGYSVYFFKNFVIQLFRK